jgi:hypothetical protein
MLVTDEASDYIDWRQRTLLVVQKKEATLQIF